MANGFESFDSIFGEVIAEWESPSSLPLNPFLFHVHSLDASHLRIHVTDFHSYTWESIRSIQQLEDLRYDIGVGGPWSEFIDYLITSIKSGNVKLVLGGLVASTKFPGVTYAKLIAHKAKGMPLITFSLERLTNSSANDAMANLSMELFKVFKSKQDGVVKEQERSYQLTKIISAEREKTESLQNQLDLALFSKKQKMRKLTTSDKALPIATAVSDSHDSKGTPQTQDSPSTKVNHRVVPAHRRAKVRGVLLDDTDEDN